jgi:hypothetical protein
MPENSMVGAQDLSSVEAMCELLLVWVSSQCSPLSVFLWVGKVWGAPTYPLIVSQILSLEKATKPKKYEVGVHVAGIEWPFLCHSGLFLHLHESHGTNLARLLIFAPLLLNESVFCFTLKYRSQLLLGRLMSPTLHHNQYSWAHSSNRDWMHSEAVNRKGLRDLEIWSCRGANATSSQAIH